MAWHYVYHTLANCKRVYQWVWYVGKVPASAAVVGCVAGAAVLHNLPDHPQVPAAPLPLPHVAAPRGPIIPSNNEVGGLPSGPIVSPALPLSLPVSASSGFSPDTGFSGSLGFPGFSGFSSGCCVPGSFVYPPVSPTPPLTPILVPMIPHHHEYMHHEHKHQPPEKPMTPINVPEPSSRTLLGAALLGMFFVGFWRRGRKH